MTAPTPVAMAVNPSNPAMYYVLIGTGRVVNYGGAPPITSQQSLWYDRTDQPVGVDIHIINWSTGAGYILDIQGGIQTMNGAPTILSGTPQTNNNGLTYVDERRYVNWSWNPAINGEGYAMDVYGEVFEFGGAPDAPRVGPRFGHPTVSGFKMSWSPTKKALSVDASGAVWADFGATAPTPPPPYFAGQDVARDLVVTDWTTSTGYVLTGDGATHGFGGAPDPLYGGPYRKGQDLARVLYVISATNPTKFRQVHHPDSVWEYVASTAPSVIAGGIGVNETQTVTIGGSPTGGTFTLTFSGQTTSALARLSTAAQVQTALQALSTIGSGNITVTGAYPVWTATFTGTLARTNVAQMTGSAALLTGGTPTLTVATVTAGSEGISPTATVTTTTRPTFGWTYSDPQSDSQAGYEVYLFTQAFVTANPTVSTDPSVFKASAVYYETGVDTTIRGVVPDTDLTNAAYRGYVRAKDTADLWSAWSTKGWTQSVTIPTMPTAMTVQPDVNPDHWRMTLTLTTSAGSNQFVRFDYTDDVGVTWYPVRGAAAVPRLTTTVATDYDAPAGRERGYRGTVYSEAPRVASLPSGAAYATTGRRVYVLTSTANSSLGGEVILLSTPEWSREAVVEVHQGDGAKYPTVISDPVLKAQEQNITIRTDTEAAWLGIKALIESPGETLVWRDPFGEVVYCRISGKVNRQQKRLPPHVGDVFPLRHHHLITIPLMQVAAPT